MQTSVVARINDRLEYLELLYGKGNVPDVHQIVVDENDIGHCVCGWKGVPAPGVRCPIAVGLETQQLWEESGRYEPAPKRRITAPVRNEPMPRNAPCFCGSGIKFKKCCGAGRT